MKNTNKRIRIDFKEVLKWFYFAVGFTCGFAADRSLILGFIGLTTMLSFAFVAYTALVLRYSNTQKQEGAAPQKPRKPR